MFMQTRFQLKRILVPVDFSNCSRKALDYARPFAKQFGAELILLHVMEPFVALSVPEMLPEKTEWSAERVQGTLEELRAMVSDDIASRAMVRQGSPHVEIVDVARELDVDLIILSTHGRTGLDHVLLGSTAEKVVRRAACPVLIVREHEHEFIRIESATGEMGNAP